MTIEELKRLVASGETRTLELKKSTGELKDGMHSACAFMNAEGGVLVFGVTLVSLKNASASASLAIYDDRVEITNLGRLPNALTVETMAKPHDSYPVNYDIANVLFKTKYIDSWGSGVERMLKACRENGIEDLEYQLRPGSIAIVFKRPTTTSNGTQCGTHSTAQKTDAKTNANTAQKTEKKTTQKTDAETSAKTSAKTSAETSAKTNKDRILDALTATSSLTLRQLAALTGLSIGGVRWNIHQLVIEKRLAHIGPSRSGHWQVLGPNEEPRA